MAKRSNKDRKKRLAYLKQIGVDPETRAKARDWSEDRYHSLVSHQKEINRRESLFNEYEVKENKREIFRELTENEFNKKIKKERKNYDQRMRYRELTKKGVPIDLARKGSSSENSFDTILDQVIGFQPLLYIFWREKSEYDSPDFVHRLIREGRGKSKEHLLSDINYFKGENFGQIGQTKVIVVKSRQEQKRIMNQYQSWHLIYDHQGQQYAPLLRVIRAIMVSIYDDMEKELFLESVLSGLEKINSDLAEILDHDLNGTELSSESRYKFKRWRDDYEKYNLEVELGKRKPKGTRRKRK